MSEFCDIRCRPVSHATRPHEPCSPTSSILRSLLLLSALATFKQVEPKKLATFQLIRRGLQGSPRPARCPLPASGPAFTTEALDRRARVRREPRVELRGRGGDNRRVLSCDRSKLASALGGRAENHKDRGRRAGGACVWCNSSSGYKDSKKVS